MAYNPFDQRRPSFGTFALNRVKNKKGEDACNLFLYDVIGSGFFGGGINPKDVADQLGSAKGAKNLNIYINSPGGDVFDAQAIVENINRFGATKNVFIDGMAASAASIIAMAGDTITMGKASFMMIHDPWGMTMGTAEEMRATADMLDKVRGTLVDTYVKRTGNSADQVSDWMHAETWFTAEDAIKNKFADKSTEEPDGDEEDPEEADALAGYLNHFKNLPAALKARASSRDAKIARMEKVLQFRSKGQSR